MHPEPSWRRDLTTALTLLFLGGLLCHIGFSLSHQWLDPANKWQEINVEAMIGIVASAAGSLLVAWWWLALSLAGIHAGLERTGRFRRAASLRRFAPAFMRRLMIAAISTQLVTGGIAHADDTNLAPQWQHPPQTVSATTAPDYPGWQPAPPVMHPGPLAGGTARANQPSEEGIAVRSGESLWEISARQLGPGATDADIANEWPRWYQANRDVIGPNPDKILPGQVLLPPQGGS